MSWAKFKQTLKRIDMFSTSQLLRYREEPEFATLTGAVLTLGIVGVIGLLVYQVLLQTVNRNQINWSMRTTKEAVPSDLTMTMQDMKFGIELFGVNLSDPTISYFDISLDLHENVNGTYSTVSVPLTTCQEQFWNTTSQVQQTFKDLEGTSWLCPYESQQFTLGGRWSSNSQKSFSIAVVECGVYEPSKTNCATPAQLSQLFADHANQLYFSIMTVTALVQPDQADPIDYYIEDDTYAVFGEFMGQDMTIDIADYSIQTDDSLLPIKNIQTVEGGFLSGKVKTYNIDPADGYYCYIRVRKSPTKFNYERTFNKIDQTLSYAGGLIGVVVGLFFVMSPYTEICYELSLANQLFKADQGEQQPVQTRMNFARYILFELYSLFKCCCPCLKSERYEEYEKCSEQVQKELDIGYLLKRVATLERLASKRSSDLSYHRQSLAEAEDRAEKMWGGESEEGRSDSSMAMVEEPPRHQTGSQLRSLGPSEQIMWKMKVEPRESASHEIGDSQAELRLAQTPQHRNRQRVLVGRGGTSSLMTLKADDVFPDEILDDF